MFRRMLAALLALMLLIPAFAWAETGVSGALYLLVSRSEEGIDTPVGSAVVFADQSTLLTSVWALGSREGLLAVGEGGEFTITQLVRPTENSELLLLTLDRPTPAKPLLLGHSQGQLSVLGHTVQGETLVSPAAHVTAAAVRTQETVLYSAASPLLPGSVLLNETGDLAGLTLSAYGEGVNRYFALTSTALLEEFTAAQAAEAAASGNWITDFAISYKDGLVAVDWSASQLSCEGKGCTFTLYYADAQNPYYSYLPVSGGTSAQLPLVPGRTYRVWLEHLHSEEANPAALTSAPHQVLPVPQLPPFALYDYRDSDIYLASAPAQDADALVNTYLPPMENITAQSLSAPDSAFFLQVFSTYAVEENIEANLLVTLTTPEQYCILYPAAFIFDTSLQHNDVWNADITRLFTDYAAFSPTGGLASGTYTLRYYLDGALANEYSFTLE